MLLEVVVCGGTYLKSVHRRYFSPRVFHFICTSRQTFGRANQEEWDGRCMLHGWERGEVQTGFWWGNLEVRAFGRPRRWWEDNIKMVLKEIDWGEWAWIGSIWPRTGTSDGLLWRRQWTFGSHKMREIYRLVEELLASQEGLCSVEFVRSFVRSSVGWLVGQEFFNFILAAARQGESAR